MESILNLEPRPEEYKAAISAITKIYKYSLAHPDIPLSRCLEGRLRTSILLDVPIESLYFTAAQTPDTRMREMYSIARKLIADNLGTELNRFIDETNLDVKKNIFRPRFENGSPLDGLNLDWDDFYSKVFSSATFNIRSDGRMSFNIDTNPCYLATYKDGDPSSTLLKIDFHLLAERLGMEFDKDSNYLGEIIFSAESSQKLISAGLHYNLDYVKKIIRERWTASLFAQAKRNPANEKQEPCPMQTLPRDICNLIADFTYADKEQGLLPAEKQAIRTLGQQDNPMTGLNMLFFKPAVQEEVILDKTPKNKCVIC